MFENEKPIWPSNSSDIPLDIPNILKGKTLRIATILVSSLSKSARAECKIVQISINLTQHFLFGVRELKHFLYIVSICGTLHQDYAQPC